jgi:flagellar biogenesis protein FliO
VLQGGLGHTLVQMGGAVVLVVALILVLQKLAHRYRPGWGGKSRDGGIEVVSQRALGSRLALLVVETHGQTLLLGTSPQGITSLANLGTGALGASSSPGRGGPATAAFRAEGAPAFPTTLRELEGSRPQGEDRPAMAASISPPNRTDTSARNGSKGPGLSARGVLRSIAARAVSKRPDDVPRSALADLEEASRIAREARERDERLAQEGKGGEVDLQEFETQFREKLRAIREKYPTLDEVEGRRA